MVAITDPAELIQHPDTVYQSTSTPLDSLLLQTTPPDIWYAPKPSSVALFISNTDIPREDTEINLPGYALRKGLRVMTLVDNRVMAFNNIIE